MVPQPFAHAQRLGVVRRPSAGASAAISLQAYRTHTERDDALNWMAGRSD
jgi:hypothetical protein